MYKSISPQEGTISRPSLMTVASKSLGARITVVRESGEKIGHNVHMNPSVCLFEGKGHELQVVYASCIYVDFSSIFCSSLEISESAEKVMS